MYLFRADGNVNIGAGHLMRSMTIAKALEKQIESGEEICFLCADEQSVKLAEENGFRAVSMDTDYRKMDTELEFWSRFCGSDRHVILVDSYFVTSAYLSELRKYGKVFLMDDMCEEAFPVDVVVNYNAFATIEAYEKLYGDTSVTKVIGSTFIPLRDEFSTAAYSCRESVQKVLITTGGGDVDNIAGAILEEIYDSDRDFYLVIGQFNPHFAKMKALEEEKKNIHILHNVRNMAELMRECDLAVTAGGSTVYELSAIGVPYIVFSYAKNQEKLAEYVGKEQISAYGGKYHVDSKDTLMGIRKAYLELCDVKELRGLYSKREKSFIDGDGAARIAKIMRETFACEV